VTFSDLTATAVSGTKSALVSIPVPAPLNMPPVIVNLSGVIDNIKPTVVLTLPADGDQNWPATNRPHVTFSEPVTGVSTTTFTIKDAGGVDVGGTPGVDATGKLVDYTLPAAGLISGTTYTATLTSGITDIAGNALTQVVFSFKAGAAVTTPPSVISTTPLDNSTSAKVSDSITVAFAGSVDPNTVNATTFFLSEGVTGSVSYDQTTKTAILKPDKPLEFFHSYTATVKGGATGVLSLAQKPMAADKTWKFLTNGAPSAPSLFLPTDQATGVAVPVQFQWVKSKDLDGEPVSYHLWYCTNPGFLGCSPVEIASAATTTAASAGSALHGTLAGLGGYGAGMLLAGFAIVGGVRSRRKIFFFIAVLAISAMATAACGKKTETVAVPVGVDPATLMSKSVSGLKPGTTYWWKVVADDGNGALIESENRSFTTL
jgi:methionine-rich copper-binding protein CopC